MRIIYFIFLNTFTVFTLFKNNLVGNYFNPKSIEANSLYDEIYLKISKKYPEIKNDIFLELDKDLKYSKAEYEEGIYNLLVSGQVVFRKRLNKVCLYSSVFNLRVISYIKSFSCTFNMCIISNNRFK